MPGRPLWAVLPLIHAQSLVMSRQIMVAAALVHNRRLTAVQSTFNAQQLLSIDCHYGVYAADTCTTYFSNSQQCKHPTQLRELTDYWRFLRVSAEHCMSIVESSAVTRTWGFTARPARN